MKKFIVLVSLVALVTPALADYASVVMADSPLAYYRFEDASSTNGATCLDSAGRSYKNGTYINKDWYDVVLGAGIPGAGGKAAGFQGGGSSGAGNCVDIWDGGALCTPSMTVELWVKGYDRSDYSRLLQHNGAWDNTNCYGIGTYGTGGIPTVMGGGTTWYTGSSPVLDLTWHHVVVTYQQVNEGADLFEDLYIDGAHIWGNVVAGKSLTCTYQRLTLGCEGNRWYIYNGLTGFLDEVAIYDTVLSGSRIAAHYAAGIPEPATIALLGLGLALLRKRS
jgi:hypothetical protein